MNRSKMLFIFTAVAFTLSVTTVSFAAEKKSGYFGAAKTEAKSTPALSANSTTNAFKGASALLGKSGDPKKFAQAMKAIKGVNPRALNAARQLGSNNAMKTLTSNPNSIKALSAMAKTKAATPSNR